MVFKESARNASMAKVGARRDASWPWDKAAAPAEERKMVREKERERERERERDRERQRNRKRDSEIERGFAAVGEMGKGEGWQAN